jgi:hypothetical protein
VVVLGEEAIKVSKRLFFAALANLVDSMRKAKREGKLCERARFLTLHLHDGKKTGRDGR